jgi:CubicO group peptidase (beta-lactamase class C family)
MALFQSAKNIFRTTNFAGTVGTELLERVRQMASEKLKRDATAATQAVIDRHVREGKETGIQVVAYLDGEKLIDIWAGVMEAGTNRPVDGDTLFNVFSVSKALCDAALWIQVERGLVDLDAPVAQYWPEFAQNGKHQVTVRQVLLHRSGVPHMPEGTTPQTIGNWDWVTRGIAALAPLFPPGSRSAYQCISQGFMLGEVIRRTDPRKRSYRQFLLDEISKPLAAPDLHHGITDATESRVAIINEPELTNLWADDSMHLKSIPKAVYLGKTVWERPEVRRAVVPSTGGIFSARSAARFWAMLAQGGVLGGARILSEKTVLGFLEPVPPLGDEPDPVILMPRVPLGAGGIWLSAPFQPALPGRGPRVLIKPGYGHSIGWADVDNRFAVAICHNQLYNPHTPEQCRMTPIGDAIRDVLGIRYA